MHPRKLKKLLEHAKLEAGEGTCCRLQVGAVIARDGRTVASGYNGSASGLDHCNPEVCYPGGPPCKNAVHAEANAIAFAAKHGIATDGCVMVSTDSPCLDCARLIINAGIKIVYYQREYRDTLPLQELHLAKVQTLII